MMRGGSRSEVRIDHPRVGTDGCRVAISEEFAGLLAKQKPGSVSKIATLTSPPYLLVAAGRPEALAVEATVETAIAAASATPARRNTRDLLV